MITSEWPPKYLVTECITISAPRSNGFCKYGEANVLSTATSILFFLAIATHAVISMMRMSGLEGVSNHISFVLELM